MSDTTAPAGSTAARILALKDASPAGPSTAAKASPPIDQARLLQLLIDLIAEQRQATIILQGTVTALTNLLYRSLQELPAAQLQVTKGEFLYLRSQLAVLVAKLTPPEAEPSEPDNEDRAATIRIIAIFAAVSAVVIIGAVILGRYLSC